ncbi:putative MFS transporter [Actinoplanes missouriensis 431]|uniref:Putative MFS transporter n=1 Tax=Actinoplanes missouriensis (strain ATCC 14538 / DSM 43046 / CBS 188.64 / JCM 3121 / NBRC 102363 / NCIMB 12654 / NRRL B-3342 / UNCC 431) TaxID=512565 RepID=I0HAC5_ACTM4|nr:MFS transporter [Actinoplanes missouriensis]BAL89962.1 putative MFS transporter [Actinoplanes missouriensis 431]
MLWTADFIRYFVARSVSVFGDAMLTVAAALAVGQVYGATGVGVVLASWMVPFLGFILFGGVFADRLGARPLMLTADVVRTVAQSVVAVAFFTGTPALGLLVACSAISGTAAAMFQPGVNGIVPQVATDPHRANAAIRTASAVAELLGPAAAGVLFAFFGAGPVYAVDAATFAISAACLMSLRIAKIKNTATSPLRDLRDGWHEFRSRTWLWSVIGVWIVFGVFLFGPLIPLGAVLVSDELGAPAYGWTQSAVGAGAIVGGLVALRFPPRRPLAAGAVAMLGYVLLPLAIALHVTLPILLAAAVVNGCVWAFWSVQWQTSVQTQVPLSALNRVTSYEVLGSDGSLPIGQALAGPVAGVAGPERVLGTSVVVGVLGCVTLLLIPAVRGLRRAENPGYSPGDAAGIPSGDQSPAGGVRRDGGRVHPDPGGRDA